MRTSRKKHRTKKQTIDSSYYYIDKRSFTSKPAKNVGLIWTDTPTDSSPYAFKLLCKCLDKFWMFDKYTYRKRCSL